MSVQAGSSTESPEQRSTAGAGMSAGADRGRRRLSRRRSVVG